MRHRHPVILDRSTSIASAGATGQVREAFRAFTAALRNTGSRISVSDFSTVARLPIPTYTPVTDATIASTFEPYIQGFQPDGYTNWEDAFRVPRFFAPRPDPNRAHLVLFITDGNPNRAINTSMVPWNPNDPGGSPYGSLLPLATGQTTTYSNTDSGFDAAHRPAIPNANALKADGSKVLAIAVGDGLAGGTTLTRLQNVSGPDTYPAPSRPSTSRRPTSTGSRTSPSCRRRCAAPPSSCARRRSPSASSRTTTPTPTSTTSSPGRAGRCTPPSLRSPPTGCCRPTRAAPTPRP